MSSLFLRILLLAALAAAVLWLLAAWVTRETVAAEAFAEGGQYKAEVVWRRVFPWYEGVDVDLVVRDARGRTLSRRPLLRQLDGPEQVAEKVRDLAWTGDEIELVKADVRHRFRFEPPPAGAPPAAPGVPASSPAR